MTPKTMGVNEIGQQMKYWIFNQVTKLKQNNHPNEGRTHISDDQNSVFCNK